MYMLVDPSLPALDEQTGQTSTSSHLKNIMQQSAEVSEGHHLSHLAEIPKGSLEAEKAFLSHTCKEPGRQLLPDIVVISASCSSSISNKLVPKVKDMNKPLRESHTF